ncbi:MAG: hypothetical protein ACD_37C00013G0001 [uncultured bacterium]|nr:MAG: hypothetical protein ACD_37C00013G0001 [uncultured bacterium]
MNRKSRRYFLEIIDEGTPRFMIRKLVEKYVTYYDAQTWERTTGYNFPKVLLLCPNENIKNFLHRYIAQILEEEAQADIAFYLALKTDFKWKNALEDIAPEL